MDVFLLICFAANVALVIKLNLREMQLKIKKNFLLGKSKWRNYWDARMLDHFFDKEEVVIRKQERLFIAHVSAYNKMVARLKPKLP